jgi:hypothetical protein
LNLTHFDAVEVHHIASDSRISIAVIHVRHASEDRPTGFRLRHELQHHFSRHSLYLRSTIDPCKEKLMVMMS